MSHLLYLDFETYYAADYTLKKMTPAEYILDPQFETIMVAVKADDGPHEIIDGPDFPSWLRQFPPEDTTTVTFNALFDNAILAWKYGYVPGTMIDAMAMARALDGHKLFRFNLAAISKHIGIPEKGSAIHNVLGMRREQIKADPYLWNSFKDYALRDNMNCESIFLHYYSRFPAGERRLMDLVIRACVEPKFKINTQLLDDHIANVVANKEALLAAANNIDRKEVMSTLKFTQALIDLGVDIEYKESPTAKNADGTPKMVPAFAKTDEFMDRLQNDPDPAVAALATARIGLKSTLEETRSRTLMRIGNLPWPSGSGTCPIPLRYGGAHTHRLSGDWKMNMQNMPRTKFVNGKPTTLLRASLEAPPGHSVVTCDLGQIEARLVSWLAGCHQLNKEFSQKLDPYNQLASEIFGRPVNRKLKGTVDEVMGFIGKTGILGLGYGCGKDKFHSMVIRDARTQKMDISAIYNRDVGDRAVDTYRRRYHEIPTAWRDLQSVIEHHWYNPLYAATPIKFGPVEIGYGYVLLPNLLKMTYDNPQRGWVPYENKDGSVNGRYEYSYRYGKLAHRLYGAKLLENISQALARIIVMNAALRIRDYGKSTDHPGAYRFVLQAHDELVFIVPNEILDETKRVIHAEMVRRPSWAKDLPLVADIGHGNSYGDAK